MWESSTGQLLVERRFDRYLVGAAFSHTSRLVAVAPAGAPAQVFDLVTNRIVYDLERTPGGSVALAFSRDDALLGTADGDGVRIYDARAGKLMSRNDDFLMEPLTVTFTMDGSQAIAAGGDKVIVFIDVATGKTMRRMKKTAEAVFYLDVSPDGRQLAAITLNTNSVQLPAPVVVWDLASLQKNTEWIPPTGILSGRGAWTEDGHFLAAAATPEALHLWRVR